MKYINLVPTFLLVVTTSFTQAYAKTESIAPVVVTATRSAQTIDDSLASVTVITKEEIEATQAVDLQDLLAGRLGIDIINNGGRGKTSSLFLRGTNSQHVLVLIDGVKIGSATLGSVSFQHIPVSQIDRIEIVRGPRSSLYGSEAIGGVIQIFTRKNAKGFSANESVTIGQYQTTKINTGASAGDDETSLSVQLSHEETDGFSSQKNNNPDDDAYKNTSISITLGHKFSQKVSFDSSFLRAETNTEYDSWNPTADYESNDAQQITTAKLTYNPNPEWKLSFGMGQSLDETQQITNGVKEDNFDTIRDRVYLQNDILLNDNSLLMIGVDKQTDTIANNQAYAKTSRNNTGTFIQHQWFTQKTDILLAVRNDNNEVFGNKTTGNIAAGYRINNTIKLSASYGSAYKAPTFNDLYFPVSGNPNLSPEQSKSSEIGITGKHEWGGWNVNLYRTDIKNLINWQCDVNCGDADPFNDIWRPFNLNTARVRGLETSTTAQLQKWKLMASLSLTDPEDLDTGNKLQQRAFRSARIDLDRDMGKLSAGVTIIGQGYRYTDTFNSGRLDGYYLLNLRAGYILSKQWRLRLKLDNALNKDYEVKKDYNTAERSIFSTISYSTP